MHLRILTGGGHKKQTWCLWGHTKGVVFDARDGELSTMSWANNVTDMNKEEEAPTRRGATENACKE